VMGIFCFGELAVASTHGSIKLQHVTAPSAFANSETSTVVML
jgi:hypothetical protein